MKQKPKPQIISGTRSKGKLVEILEELLKVGITDFKVQDGDYSTNDPRTNIANAHKKCIRYAKEKGWDYCIVMEDDVAFPDPNAFNYFIESMSKLPLDWDIYTSGFYTCSFMQRDYENIHRIAGMAGFHLYAVNSKFYDTFLSAPEHYHIDQWSTAYELSKTFCCYPFAAYQKPGYSENVKKNVDYSNLITPNELYKRTE